MLVVTALTALGCGAPEPTANGPDRGHQARNATGKPTRHLPGDLFDRADPTIHHLDPDLLDALEHAAQGARDDGVRLLVTSGWRSRAHQQRLFDEAVARYGSVEEARRWVSTPDTSAHVTGDAVDIGPTDAADWLGRNGAAYGLCQTFANEIWHFELATNPGGQCPEMLPDSSYRG